MDLKLEAQSTIFLSIKPQFVSLISTGKKNHEFRKYIPHNLVKHIIVYTCCPVGEIRYILTIENIIKYPDKIDEQGVGNKDFNEGKKKSIYAYRIKNVYQLDEGISLSFLKNHFLFSPPQRFLYGTSQEDLLCHIGSLPKRRIQ